MSPPSAASPGTRSPVGAPGGRRGRAGWAPFAALLGSAACGGDPPAAPSPAAPPGPAAPPPRTPETDPAFGTDKPLVRHPRPVATGGRAVDLFAWAGPRLIGADARGLASVLFAWDDPGREPRELARIPGRAQGLLPAPGGRLVAVEVAYPRDPEVWDSEDPASLVLLDPATGRVRSLLGATEPLGLERACWSPDGGRLAVVARDRGTDPPHRAFARVLEAASGRVLTCGEPGRSLAPLRWDDAGLLLVAESPAAWARCGPGGGVPAPTAAPAWTSPDGEYQVEPHPDGLLVRRRALERLFRSDFSGDAAALATWGRAEPPAWAGPHRLALQVGDEILALDLATLRWRPLSARSDGLPASDEAGRRLLLAHGAEPWWALAP